MNYLNDFEMAVLLEIASHNVKKYPFLISHLPLLTVISRKATGVGMYISFAYSALDNVEINDNVHEIVLSSDKQLYLNALKFGLNYELNITNGMVDFLELVTNGESWSGNYHGFKFLENNCAND